jgi:2-polyprenyl-3-methyl-5-hydroxy-6-metoxy-1,4-benzoquinol methylase
MQTRMTAAEAAAMNHAYWASCNDTHLADGAYYRRVRDVLPLLCDVYLTPGDHVLDVGCGNGEYTQYIASRCRHVRAFDLSAQLVEQARARAVPNVEFRTGDVASLSEHRDTRFDAVFVMGVFVTIHGDRFASAVSELAALVRPRGVLVTRDSVTMQGEIMRHVSDGYVAHYRSADTFVDTISAAGFELERSVFLEPFKEMTNSFFVFRRLAA